MTLELIGPAPFERDSEGRQRTRIGTLFPDYSALYTRPPEVHAVQRLGFIERVNALRAAQGLAALAPEQEEAISATSVDLIFESDHILIRPDPDRMDLAFAADELLQTLVSKREIRFLSVSDRRVREAIKRRGECWRLSSIPKTLEGKRQLIFSSKVGIQGPPIYFYNRLTGTRWLTYQEFEELGRLPDSQLAAILGEIADHLCKSNRLGCPELRFFATDLKRFDRADFDGADFAQLPPAELRARFDRLRAHFRASVHEAFRKDECAGKAWCERMLGALFLEGNEAETDQVLSGLSPEFAMQVEWLPGGRFEEGEFLFDSVFEEAARSPEDQALQHLCDARTKGIVLNLVRDYGNLEYVNLGCVPESLSLDRPQRVGRRAVYLVEFKIPGEFEARKRLLRFQKWGVWEHLDEGKDLLQSSQESDDYTDYCLDRRLGCRQLGMNLVRRILVRRLTETYRGTNSRFQGATIRTAYFERDYLPGIATDKLPAERYTRSGYALAFARLLGQAAVAGMLVGRSLELGTHPVFDDGDEVVQEGPGGLPVQILVSDHTGAFGEYRQPLETAAAVYARPINKRDRLVPDPKAFGETYLEAFREQFLHVQSDYRKRRRAFDSLFKHCVYDPAGSFAFRWESVLRRLDQTDAETLVGAIRSHVAVLKASDQEKG